VVSPPPAPVSPPPIQPLAVAPKPKPKPKPKPHRSHRKARAHPAPAPVPVSRGAGGPARTDVGFPVVPVAFHTPQSASISQTNPDPSQARFVLLFAIALGLTLVLASALPGQALRPAFVHEVVVVHRLDLALLGGSIVVLVGALYLLTG
jgi:hypothetical protein